MIKSRAPLRLGLAGGGTDIKSYSDKFGGAVLNVTIQKYIYCTIDTNTKNEISFTSIDKKLNFICELTNRLNTEGDLLLHKAVYKYVMDNFNKKEHLPLNVTTYSEIPSGSGLGSSSTLVIAMLVAYMKLLNININEYEVAEAAYYIERGLCKLDGGMQDQYSASFGGFNHIIFETSGNVIVNKINPPRDFTLELESKTLLYFTGISRDSEDIIINQKESIINNEKSVLNSMHELKKEVDIMKDAINNSDIDAFSESLNMSWRYKKNTAEKISNRYIESILEHGISNGATAGKVSGAGGGGFILLFTPLEYRSDVIKSLEHFDGQFFDCQICFDGAEAWEHK
jgi:D-glycero-alpha-D-manno-heptose-7-phosphate kinase